MTESETLNLSSSWRCPIYGLERDSFDFGPLQTSSKLISSMFLLLLLLLMRMMCVCVCVNHPKDSLSFQWQWYEVYNYTHFWGRASLRIISQLDLGLISHSASYFWQFSVKEVEAFIAFSLWRVKHLHSQTRLSRQTRHVALGCSQIYTQIAWEIHWAFSSPLCGCACFLHAH